MTNEQYKAMMLQLESIAHNTKLIADTLHKLARPPIPVDNVLSQQDLDSLAGLPSGFMPVPSDLIGKEVRVQTVGLRNQKPAIEAKAVQDLILKRLDDMHGMGYRLESYREIMLQALRNLEPNMSAVQMESTILIYTGNSIEAHWENQADYRIKK